MLFFSLLSFSFRVLSSHATVILFLIIICHYGVAAEEGGTGTATLKIQQQPLVEASLLAQGHLLSRPSYHVQRSFAPISLSLIFSLFFFCLFVCSGVS